MSRRPIIFTLPPEIEAELVRYARDARRSPWTVLVEAVAAHVDYTQPAGFVFVLGLQLDLHANGQYHPTENLPTGLAIDSNQLTQQLWERLRDEYGARIHCTIPGLLEALEFEE